MITSVGVIWRDGYVSLYRRHIDEVLKMHSSCIYRGGLSGIESVSSSLNSTIRVLEEAYIQLARRRISGGCCDMRRGSLGRCLNY